MSDIDSDDECPNWDWFRQQGKGKSEEKKSIPQDPVTKIVPESYTGETTKTGTPIPKQTVRPKEKVDLRTKQDDQNKVKTKKSSGSRHKLSTSYTGPEQTSNTRESTDVEIKQIKLLEELADIKLKVKRAKNNREIMRQIYQERNNCDSHDNERYPSFAYLRELYVR